MVDNMICCIIVPNISHYNNKTDFLKLASEREKTLRTHFF